MNFSQYQLGKSLREKVGKETASNSRVLYVELFFMKILTPEFIY
jgi:hypothetical protein